MTTLLISLLLALPQSGSAEDAFNKVEAAIESARTVRVTFTIDAANEESRPGKGTLSLEEGGRVRIEGVLRDKNGEKVEFSEESDGQKIISAIGPLRAEGR
ncbi:MAG: hypothetical protein EHM91_06520, partial [Planctomycetota bacterium]